MGKHNGTTALGDKFHRFLGQSPTTWRITALELKYAADIVAARWFQDLADTPERSSATRPPPMLGGSYMLLAAFAVENLAKAILIQRNANLFPLTEARSGGIKTHHLDELTDRIDASWSTEERKLLNRLADFAIWSGRYPVPVSHRDLDTWPGLVYAHDPSEVNALFRKLLQILNAAETTP